MDLILAKTEDLECVEEMYRSVIGQNGCTWNEFYPIYEDALYDLNHKCLYILKNNNNTLGAVSVVSENELDDIECWKVNDGTQKEIARVVVPPKYQGNGYSKSMISRLITVLKEIKCKSIHLLVAKSNKPAIKPYKSLGFEFLGECNKYEHDFYICELVLNHIV